MARPLRIAFPGAFYHVNLKLEKDRKRLERIERFEKRVFVSDVET
jgi:hypothetical protein